MTLNNTIHQKTRKPGAKPVWLEKYPRIAQLMDNTGLRAYEIAIIVNMHPDSLGRKLRYGTLSDDETDRIISEVIHYVEQQAGTTHDRTTDK